MIIDKEQYYLDIMNAIDLMDGHDFEDFCAILLRNNGFRDVTVTPNSGDYGIDILARYHNKIYGIQCKRYSKPVGIEAIRDTLGGYDYYKCDTIAVLTNNTFTPNAITQAKISGVRLWDREYLVNNLIDTCEDIEFIEHILKDEIKANQKAERCTNIHDEIDVKKRKDSPNIMVIEENEADNILKKKTEPLSSMEDIKENSETDIYNKETIQKKLKHKQIKVKDYTICDEGIYISNKICSRNMVNVFRWFCLASGFTICIGSLLVLIIDIILGIGFCLFGICAILYSFKIKEGIKLYDSQNSKK